MEAVLKTVREVGNAIINSLAGGLTKAAGIYSEFLRNGGSDADLRKEFPQISSRTWTTLRAVAEGRLSPRLASELGGEIKTALLSLPKEEQDLLVSQGVELLTANGDTLRVKLSAMTPYQRRQVIGTSHLRSLPEQRAWIESQRTKAAVKAPRHAAAQFEVDVRKKELRVLAPCAFSRIDLRRILKQMEG